MKAVTQEEAEARARQLRKLGYKIKRIPTPWGAVYLRSKKRFVCSGSHCVYKPGTPPPMKRRRKVAKRRRAA